MIIERYDAAPALAAFLYTTVSLNRDYRLTQVCVFCNAVSPNYNVFVYKGSINAYLGANNLYALWSIRSVPLAGATYPTHTQPVCEVVDLVLPAGTYTFACYLNVAGMTNFKQVFMLQ